MLPPDARQNQNEQVRLVEPQPLKGGTSAVFTAQVAGIEAGMVTLHGSMVCVRSNGLRHGGSLAPFCEKPKKSDVCLVGVDAARPSFSFAS